MRSRIHVSKVSIAIALVIAAIAIHLSRIAWAEDGGSAEPPFSRLLSNGTDTAAVTIQKSSGKVDIRLLDTSKIAPPSVAFIFGESGSVPVILDLRSLSPDETTAPSYSGYLPPSAKSALNQGNESFVGIEITIPWPFGRTSVINSADTSAMPELSFFK